MKLWIARGDGGTLEIHQGKPSISKITGRPVWVNGGFVGFVFNDIFPEVTFKNSPQEVELKLVNEIVGVAESPSKTFPRVNEFETGASYRR